MSFLSRLLSRFRGSSDSAPTVERELPVASTECLTRFLFNKRHFSRPKNAVLADAFLPPPNLMPWQTSTYRTSTLSDERIWALGEAVRGERAESLKAKAEILAGRIVTVGDLRVKPSSDGVTVSPELHADIVGWPDSAEQQRMLATELAALATLRLRPVAESA